MVPKVKHPFSTSKPRFSGFGGLDENNFCRPGQKSFLSPLGCGVAESVSYSRINVPTFSCKMFVKALINFLLDATFSSPINPFRCWRRRCISSEKRLESNLLVQVSPTRVLIEVMISGARSRDWKWMWPNTKTPRLIIGRGRKSCLLCCSLCSSLPQLLETL